MKVTAYIDVLSLWCLYADRSLDGVLARHGARIDFDWKISLISGTRPLGYPPALGAWYYRRGEAITGQALTPDWFEEGARTLDANLVAEAARSLGASGRTVYRALMDAAMVEGRPVHQPVVAAEVAAQASGLDAPVILKEARRVGTRHKVLSSTEEMLQLGVNQRPVIVCENVIPDRAILSGVWAYEPIAALCDAMLKDEHHFLTFNRDNAEPPRHRQPRGRG